MFALLPDLTLCFVCLRLQFPLWGLIKFIPSFTVLKLLLLCCHSAHVNVIFQSTKSDMQTFEDSQNTTCQTMWALLWCLTFWLSLTKTPQHSLYFCGRCTHTSFWLFLCASSIRPCHIDGLNLPIQILLSSAGHPLYLINNGCSNALRNCDQCESWLL